MTKLDPAVLSAAIPSQDCGTPIRVFSSEILRSRADLFLQELSEISSYAGCKVEGCYSVKTNSDRRILGYLRGQELIFDVISLLELKKCLALDINSNRLISNGPGKWWPMAEMPSGRPCFHTINCDSIDDLKQTIRLINNSVVHSAVLGLRLAPIGIPSRFGMACDTELDLRVVRPAVEQLLATGLTVGLQCHMAAHKIGREQWSEVMAKTLTRFLSAFGNLDRKVLQIDLGGGWPAEWLENGDFAGSIVDVISSVRKYVTPDVRYVVEPGRLIVQPSMVLVTRALAIRGDQTKPELVVDGSVADLPTTSARSRDIWWRPSTDETDTWRMFTSGSGSILGRLCMERDVLASNIHVPTGIEEGDFVIFSDAGGYDSSMAYSDFGT